MKLNELNNLRLKDFDKLIMEKKKKYLTSCIHFYEKKKDIERARIYNKQLKKLERLLSFY